MTWASHAQRPERTPCTVVEVDLDWIAAEDVLPVNPDGSLCYRTPATTSQGDLAWTTRTRRWMTTTQRPIPELGAIPCLRSAKISPEEVRLGRGLGYFGQVTVEVQDFVDDDRREDPFITDASRAGFDPAAGTYLGKLLARNPWWSGRRLRVLEGWASDGVWHAADAITHHFFIRDVQGPSDGRLRITAAGPLQLLNLEDREAPTPSRGRLASALAEDGTSCALETAADLADYAASGFVRLGDEILGYTRTDPTLTLVRARFGTEAAEHAAGTSVQACAVYADRPATEIVADLLTTFGGVSPSSLALEEWAAEQATWLSLYRLSGIVSQPTKLLDLVREVLESAACLLWWDDSLGKVRLRALRPALASSGTWTDRFHLLGPIEVRRDLGERVSRCDVLMDLRSGTEDATDPASYRMRLIGESAGENATEHGSPQVRLLASRWFSAAQVGLALRASAQLTSQLRDGRQTIAVEVSAKDAARGIGDVVDLLTRDLVDRRGQPLRTRAIVVCREAAVLGSRYRYLLERTPFDGRFAFMTDVGWPAYDQAAGWQRDPGAFMSAGGAPFAPTDPPYLMG